MQHQPMTIATGVRNLTDARYFAAMGVHWMGFSLTGESALSTSQVRSIKDWVAVPKYFVEISPSQQHDIPDLIGALDIDAVVTGFRPDVPSPQVIWRRRITTENILLPGDYEDYSGTIFLDLVGEKSAQHQSFHKNPLSDVLADICAAHETWIALQWDPDTMPELIEKVRPAGVVLDAGDEEVIGVKSYTDLDRIFASLEK